jgi:mono/diheme cytochrome c family protein
MKTILSTVIVIIVLIVAGGALFIYSGTYNVAATNQDTGFTYWLLDTTREESIERRAEDVVPPPEAALNNPQTLRAGFIHYDEMCVVCHGAPGIEPGEGQEGMNPQPPLLADTADEIPTREMFWVIKHGIKMTGMPAWGPTHDDSKIWAMVAFVKMLPTLSPNQYKVMQEQAEAMEGAHDDEHEHEHMH